MKKRDETNIKSNQLMHYLLHTESPLLLGLLCSRSISSSSKKVFEKSLDKSSIFLCSLDDDFRISLPLALVLDGWAPCTLAQKKAMNWNKIWQFYRISLLKRKQASTSEEHAVGFEVSFDCFSELSLLVVLSGESPSLSPTFSSESDLLDAGTHLAHSSRLRIFSPYKSTRTSCYDQTDMSD